jgi:hypothetical protein
MSRQNVERSDLPQLGQRGLKNRHRHRPTISNFFENISMGELQGSFFWDLLLDFSVAMYLLPPRSNDETRLILPLALPRYRMSSAGGTA